MDGGELSRVAFLYFIQLASFRLYMRTPPPPSHSVVLGCRGAARVVGARRVCPHG
jgi:hypothetical protein